MRVLWFATNSACYNNNHLKTSGYNGGGWMSSLQLEISKFPNIELGISFCMDNQPFKTTQNNVIYYPVSSHIKSLKNKILDLIYYKDETRDNILWRFYIDKFKEIILDFKPDIIEVFGSELYTGLSAISAKELKIPCVLHIQGILGPCQNVFLPPTFSNLNFITSQGFKNIYSNFQYLVYWNRSCYRERAILESVPNVIGRTDWDMKISNIYNNNVKYYYGGEILRSCFYEESKRILPTSNKIISIISFPLYKGYDVILKTAYILKYQLCVDFEWEIYGNPNHHYIDSHLNLNHKDLNIKLCGVASAVQIKDALLNSTVYFQSSYIENSPNTLAEAQILGIPVVATNVGGTSSLVKHGETGYLFPCTEPHIGAFYINELIKDKSLNQRIGEDAKAESTIRHNKNTIVNNLISTYSEIINKYSN